MLEDTLIADVVVELRLEELLSAIDELELNIEELRDDMAVVLEETPRLSEADVLLRRLEFVIGTNGNVELPSVP